MVVSGRVIDAVKKAALQGAAVTILNAAGGNTGVSVTVDDVGYFYLSSPLITLDSMVMITHPDYYSKQLPVTGAVNYGLIGMEIKPIAPRPAEEIPEPEPETKNNGWLWWLAGFGLLFYLDQTKKSR